MGDSENDSSKGVPEALRSIQDGIDQTTEENASRDQTQSVGLSRTIPRHGVVAKVLRAVSWMPPWCRYDPYNPPTFTLSMNILLALV